MGPTGQGPRSSRTNPATGRAVLLTVVLTALLALGLTPSLGAWAVVPVDPPPDSAFFLVDAHSRSFPQPPANVDAAGLSGVSQAAVVIPGVPAYLWRHGCGPTALGMVIGYWDGRGFDALVPGSAVTQTGAVNEMIASEGPASNYTDYCLPIDVYPDLLPDKSEDPAGDEHPDNCLADYVYTSQSRYGNVYGVGFINHMAPGIKAFVSSLGSGYTMAVGGATVASNPEQAWSILRSEMEIGRPMVLLVDTEGDNETDHFVTAIGYDIVDGVRRYACYDTWDTDIHWFTFAPMAAGQPWGVWGYLRFRVTLSTPTPTPSRTPTWTLTPTTTWTLTPTPTQTPAGTATATPCPTPPTPTATPSAAGPYMLHLPALLCALPQPAATSPATAIGVRSPAVAPNCARRSSLVIASRPGTAPTGDTSAVTPCSHACPA